MPHGCQMITVAAAGSCNNKQLQRQTAGRKLRYKNDNEQIMNKSEKGQFSYQIIRSDRRTLSLIVRRGEVLVRAPYRHSLWRHMPAGSFRSSQTPLNGKTQPKKSGRSPQQSFGSFMPAP